MQMMILRYLSSYVASRNDFFFSKSSDRCVLSIQNLLMKFWTMCSGQQSVQAFFSWSAVLLVLRCAVCTFGLFYCTSSTLLWKFYRCLVTCSSDDGELFFTSRCAWLRSLWSCLSSSIPRLLLYWCFEARLWIPQPVAGSTAGTTSGYAMWMIPTIPPRHQRVNPECVTTLAGFGACFQAGNIFFSEKKYKWAKQTYREAMTVIQHGLHIGEKTEDGEDGWVPHWGAVSCGE